MKTKSVQKESSACVTLKSRAELALGKGSRSQGRLEMDRVLRPSGPARVTVTREGTRDLTGQEDWLIGRAG